MSDQPMSPEWWQASDGRWYPPQPVAPRPPAPPPSSGMPGCLIAFLIVLAVGAVLGLGSCAVLAIAVDEAADDVEEDDAEERADVADPTCEADELGLMVAVIGVTNRSSERSNYFIDVTFEAPDGSQLDTGSAIVNALEPGQTTTVEAMTATEAPANGAFSCRLANVERFSDE